MKSALTAPGKRPLPSLLSLSMLLLMLLEFTAANKVKVYPLADEYFEKIYLVEQHNHLYYLNISCRDVDMLSISISQEKQF